jgi:lycopene beta-cyclase
MATGVDIAIVGGGLAGGLIAWALKTRRPDIKLALFEKGPRLGGEHTWSFHDTDISPADRAWLTPLISARWDTQEVRFPEHQRFLGTSYNSITSDRFNAVLATALGDSIRLNVPITRLTPGYLSLAGGELMPAGAVLDCRGDFKSPCLVLGFQKFLGRVCRLSSPHDLDAPIIMDATVPQNHDYRFIYVLPFDPRTLLIEDTRYSDSSRIDSADFRTEIDSYARCRGWEIKSVLREESGVLPVALGGDIKAFWDNPLPNVVGEIGRAGMRASLFHPVTGYSLPDAVALANKISTATDLSSTGLYALTRSYSEECWHSRGFYRFLSRMLFRGAPPENRYLMLERFYRLPQGVIERFYAGVSTFTDKVRILSGKPPIPISRALAEIRER